MSANNWALFGIALVTGLAASVGCTANTNASGNSRDDPWGGVEIAAAGSVQVGLLTSEGDTLVGNDAKEQQRGAELAVADHGPINGFPVTLVPVNAPCSGDGGVSAATLITKNQSITAAVGPSCNSACVESSALFESAHLLAISGSCGIDELTQPSGHPEGFLRTVHSDLSEGSLAATFAYLELGKRRAAILSYGSVDSQDFVSSFSERMNALGGVVVANIQVVKHQADFEIPMRALLSNRPDVIYAPLLPSDAAQFVRFRHSSDQEALPIIGNRYYWSRWFLGSVGEPVTNVYASGPYLTRTEYGNISSEYVQTYNEPPSNTTFAYAYDATFVLLQALDRASTVGSSKTMFIGRKALLEAINGTTGYQGVTGILTCTDWGDCSVTSIAIGSIENGDWRTVFIP